MVEKMGEGRESGLTRMGTVVDDEDNDDDKAKEKVGNTGGDTIIDIRET